MDQTPLIAEKRTILGRKVKTLREKGVIPAHVFGKNLQTEHVQVKGNEFLKVFDKVGETGIIALTIGDAKKPVLVRNADLNPITDDLIHIDFYQVNLSEKVKVNVPVEIVGQSPAVERKVGLLLTPLAEIEVEALPGDLPESIEVDVSSLAEIGDQIKVKDLKVDRSKIELLADEDLIVTDIGELVTKEMEALEAEVEAEQAEAAAEAATEGAEGEEAKAEGAEEGARGETAATDTELAEKPQEEKANE